MFISNYIYIYVYILFSVLYEGFICFFNIIIHRVKGKGRYYSYKNEKKKKIIGLNI